MVFNVSGKRHENHMKRSIQGNASVNKQVVLQYRAMSQGRGGLQGLSLSNHLHIWNLKKIKIQMNLFTKQNPRHRKQTYGYQRGKGVDEV